MDDEGVEVVDSSEVVVGVSEVVLVDDEVEEGASLVVGSGVSRPPVTL